MEAEYPEQVILDAVLLYGLTGALMQARDAVNGVALWPISESARKLYLEFLERHDGKKLQSNARGHG